ncbi:hypothetical protein AC7_A0015 [Clostridium perfringens NCTC 8239]|nr:hypothetical protein AC7_A0015 [Clostridium perfringens NCTC 8239]
MLSCLCVSQRRDLSYHDINSIHYLLTLKILNYNYNSFIFIYFLINSYIDTPGLVYLVLIYILI